VKIELSPLVADKLRPKLGNVNMDTKHETFYEYTKLSSCRHASPIDASSADLCRSGPRLRERRGIGIVAAIPVRVRPRRWKARIPPS
jgi:hypothetical protein